MKNSFAPADRVVGLLANPDHARFVFTFGGTRIALVGASNRALAQAARHLRVARTRRQDNGQYALLPAHPEQMPRRAVPVKASAQKRRRAAR